VGGAERVVFALRALGEAGEAAALPQGADPVATAGQDLVRIGLVADVPDQDVGGRLIDVVQRHRQLDHAKPRAQVAAGHRDSVDGLEAHLVRKLPKFGDRKAPRVRGRCDGVEQRRRGGHGRKRTGHAELVLAL
jgi:hypothetical protein